VAVKASTMAVVFGKCGRECLQNLATLDKAQGRRTGQKGQPEEQPGVEVQDQEQLPSPPSSLATAEMGEKWPSGQEHSFFIFSPCNIHKCPNLNHCAIGLTVLIPSNRLSFTCNTRFPIAIAYSLTRSPHEGNTTVLTWNTCQSTPTQSLWFSLQASTP
jgi:hypothetical protein